MGFRLAFELQIQVHALLGSGKELWHFLRALKSFESFWYVTKRFALHLLDVLKFGRGMTLTNGNALAGRLAKAAMDLNISVWLDSPVRKLIIEGDAVVGVTIVREGTVLVAWLRSQRQEVWREFLTPQSAAELKLPAAVGD